MTTNKNPTHFADVEYSVPVTFVDPAVADTMLQVAREQNFFVARANFTRPYTDKALFTEIADAFHFPDYFGHNWDALDECLADLDWIPSDNYVLFVDNALEPWSEVPILMGDFVDIWQTAALPFLREKQLLRLVFIW